jgi:hypothetical protein
MHRILRCLPLLLLVGCPAEDPGDPVVDTLDPPLEGQGFQLSIDVVAPANSEVWKCVVYPMPHTEISAVNSVEYIQTPGTHHMTLSTLGFNSAGRIDHGTYDCETLYGESSLMQEQVMFFGAQGQYSDFMQLPENTAANFPLNMDVIHEVHFVNATDEDIPVFSRVNAYTIPQDTVDEQIWGGQVRDETISIPADGVATEWTRCEMNMDVEVLFLASHTHALGTEFTIRRWDGENAGDVFYTNNDWHDPFIQQYDPPLVIPAGTGFEYSCTWHNWRDEPVSYGLTSEDEMCNLAIVHTPFNMSALCDVVETSDGVLWSPPEDE